MEKSARVVKEIASQRRHFRIAAPIHITTLGDNEPSEPHPTKDWSVGGFCLKNYIGNGRTGDQLDVKVDIAFSGFYISFVNPARILRISPQGEMAAEFVELEDRNRALLKHFSDSLISGEMSSIEETLRRIDIPVTPVSERPDKTKESGSDRSQRHRRTLARSAFYVAAGILLAVYAFNTVYSNVFKVRIASAALASSDSVVDSPLAGTVDEAYVAVGDSVRQGDPLFYIRDDDTLESVEMARLSVVDSLASLEEKQRELDSQKDLLESYRKFGNNELEIARAKTTALRERLRLAEKRYERNAELNGSGLLSDDMLDKISEELIVLRADLQVAVAEEKMARSAVEEIDNGRFYTDNRLEGKVAELAAAVAAAEHRVDLERQKLDLIEKRRLRLQVTAPTDGKVVSVYTGQHQLIEKGQPLLVLEQEGEKEVEAFVSARDLDRVNLDRPATIYFEGKTRGLMATVASVERHRIQGLDGDLAAPQTIRLKLAFATDDTDGSVHELPNGFPVTVEFATRPLTDRMPLLSFIGGLITASMSGGQGEKQ